MLAWARALALVWLSPDTPFLGLVQIWAPVLPAAAPVLSSEGGRPGHASKPFERSARLGRTFGFLLAPQFFIDRVTLALTLALTVSAMEDRRAFVQGLRSIAKKYGVTRANDNAAKKKVEEGAGLPK